MCITMVQPFAFAAAAAVAACGVGLGCATPSGPGSLRFANRDPVWRVNDRRSIPKPKAPYYSNDYYGLEADYFRHITYQLELPERTRAANVNSVDEVPDSTWFTNRNGLRALSIAEIVRGPVGTTEPDDSRPWKVVGAKSAGAAVGFRIEDARGDVYLLKFDSPGHPEVESGADIVAQRLLWACGWNVSDNSIVYFSHDQLVTSGEEDAPDASEIARLLAKVERNRNGTFRALASKFVPGEPIGGIDPEGVRQGDPNDTVPHENRREMRGLYTVAAWLNHTDIKPANTIDTWMPDPADPSKKYVVHYLLDYGKALGAMVRVDPRPQDGFAHATDFTAIGKSLVTLGLWQRPWERIGPFPRYRGLPWLESREFDPASWRPLHPWIPFEAADRFDKFWGAKLVMSFTPAQIRAALEAARYSDARTVEHLLGVLIERQRKIGRHFFRKVAPLDRFRVEADRLCFDDLWLRHRLGRASGTVYAAIGYGESGETTGWARSVRPGAFGAACLGRLPRLVPNGYFIIEVRAARAGERLPPVFVHLAAPAAGGPARVVGIRRE